MKFRPVKLAATALLFLLAALLLAAPCAADVVHLKSGQKLEGRVISETPTHIKLQTRFGTTEIARAKIAAIIKGKTPREEYQARRAALKEGDLAGMFELAIFCKENRLRAESKRLLDQILKTDPDHDGANREIGRIQYHGKWFTKEELAEYKENERREMEARGLVLHEGKWMTPEEAMKAKGYIEVDGQWITREEADRLLAARDFEEFFGMPLTISDSEHFSVRNTRTDEENQYLLDVCEDAWDHFLELAQPDEKEQKFFDIYKVHIYIFEHPEDVSKFIETGYIDRYKPPRDTKERYIGTTNFSYFFPMPLVVLSEGRHLVAGGGRETALTGMAMIHVGQILIRRLKRGGGLPGWAEGGVAHYVEGEFNGYSTISVVEYPHYEPYVDKWIDGWETFTKWREKLANPSVRNSLPTLQEIMELPIEELKVDALAKSWSLVTFLLDTRREQLFRFVRDAKIKFRGERISCTQAFRDAFAPENAAEVEAAWLKWLDDPQAARRDALKKKDPGVLRAP